MTDIVRVPVVGTAEAGVWHPQWRTIESAPRDGTEILLGHSMSAFDGHWSAERGGWVDGETNSYGELLTYRPTHWMPLPDPPTSDA